MPDVYLAMLDGRPLDVVELSEAEKRKLKLTHPEEPGLIEAMREAGKLLTLDEARRLQEEWQADDDR